MSFAASPRSDDVFVSCLMVTQPDRLPFLVQSVTDYCRQTHRRRELVIVLSRDRQGFDADVTRYIHSLGRGDVRVVEAGSDIPLGALRNLSVDAARGDVICQWDDDDRQHPARIAEQLNALRQSGRTACLLQDVFHLWAPNRTLYWLHWSLTAEQVFPGSLMADRRAIIRYPENGPEATRGEDTVVLMTLLAKEGVHPLAGAPHLLVYVAHGRNTWPDSHHRMLADRLSLSRAILLRREQVIREGLRAFNLGGEPIVVTGSNGPAFAVAAASGHAEP